MIKNVFLKILENSISVQDSYLTTCAKLTPIEYFQAKHYKNMRFENLKKHFQNNSNSKKDLKLVLGSNFAFKNWRNIKKYVDVNSVEFIDESFFLETPTSEQFNQKCEFLKGKVLLTTNHDICGADIRAMQLLQRFYTLCDSTIFAGWDWDNHHNIAISSVYALSSDIYFPSQRANEYELSVISARTCFLAPSAYEWPRDFLVDNFDVIINTKRIKNIFGTFNSYPRFVLRNQYISTLTASIPDINFTDNFSVYLASSPKEKLIEWCQAKWHWIVPTFNAVSVRAFYALISGVGVILPMEFKFYEEFKDLDDRDVIWYTGNDVLDTSRVQNLAEKKFDESGLDGIVRRHRWALDNHNLDQRVRAAVNVIFDLIQERTL
jgi:hypothetical protein